MLPPAIWNTLSASRRSATESSWSTRSSMILPITANSAAVNAQLHRLGDVVDALLAVLGDQPHAVDHVAGGDRFLCLVARLFARRQQRERAPEFEDVLRQLVVAQGAFEAVAEKRRHQLAPGQPFEQSLCALHAMRAKVDVERARRGLPIGQMCRCAGSRLSPPAAATARGRSRSCRQPDRPAGPSRAADRRPRRRRRCARPAALSRAFRRDAWWRAT